jgi:hypothetical protein
MLITDTAHLHFMKHMSLPPLWWLLNCNISTINDAKIIDKAIPLQAWTGPEASRRLRLPDFQTFGT